MSDRLSKRLKQWAKRGFESLGVKVGLLRHQGAGTDLCFDIHRRVPPGRIRTIFDVGANVGQTAEMFAKSFPEARVLSFEPVEATFRQLVSHTARLSNVQCVQSAFGAEEGSLRLYHQADSQWNSLVQGVNRASHSDSYEDISVKTVDEFCRSRDIERIDLLKTDTEGYDLEVLRGASRMLESGRCLFVYSEVTFCETDKQHSNFAQIHEFLKERNYSFVALYDQVVREDLLDSAFANALFANPRAF